MLTGRVVTQPRDASTFCRQGRILPHMRRLTCAPLRPSGAANSSVMLVLVLIIILECNLEIVSFVVFISVI